jgi:hypothetical protein
MLGEKLALNRMPYLINITKGVLINSPYSLSAVTPGILYRKIQDADRCLLESRLNRHSDTFMEFNGI